MARLPLILVSPSIEKHGVEFHDISSSLSIRYEAAIIAAGGIPVVAPASTDRAILAESVRRTDGVLLTGGDDINPLLYADLYQPKLSAKIFKTVEQTPDNGARDVRELVLIEEIFRQRKPVLGICRGHQMLHVAFGGRLIVDIRSQLPGALNHQQLKKPLEVVHEATLTPGSLLSKICKTRVLGVNSTHHQGIANPVDPFVATARSRDGIVEAMELRRGFDLPFFLSVQFHPERLVQRHARYRAIFKKFVAACAKILK
jgi:putative glutamine amidotransferase